MQLNDVLARLHGVESQTGGQYAARCPAHEDERASLSLSTGGDGKVLVHCHAGCSVDSIVAALGIGLRDLFADNGADKSTDKNTNKSADKSTNKSIAATYDYTDESARLLYQVVRFEPKDFRQRRPDGMGGWTWKLDGVRRVLYRLPQIRAAVAAGQRIYIVEGEKDVHAVEAAGGVATSNPGGAGKWRAAYTSELRGADVVIVADTDAPGFAHARHVATALRGIAAKVVLVEPAEGKDVSEHLAAGKTLGELVRSPSCTATLEEPTTGRVADPSPWRTPASEGWPEPVDGAAWLDRVRGLLTEYVVLPAGAADFLSTFALATHCLEAFDVAPYVAVLSPAPECGKTRLLEVLELVVARPWCPVTLTGPVLFRGIEAKRPTLLVDEAEVVRQDGDAAQNVRALLHAGYRRGKKADRCVGERFSLVEFEIFGPKVFAAIGELPGTLFTRCVTIRLRRRAPTEPVGRFHPKALAPVKAELQAQAGRFASAARATLEAYGGPLPAFLSDRQEEVWYPEFAIAAVAGGVWPARVEAAARALLTPRREVEGEQMLRDCRAVFEERAPERLTSASLMAALNQIETSPWGDWNKGKGITTQRLAALLRPFGVMPTQWREGAEAGIRGYERTAFAEAWGHYLEPEPSGGPTPPPDSLHSLHHSNDATISPPRESLHPECVATLQMPETPSATGLVASVAVPVGGEGQGAPRPPEDDPDGPETGGGKGRPAFPPPSPAAPRGDAWEPEP